MAHQSKQTPADVSASVRGGGLASIEAPKSVSDKWIKLAPERLYDLLVEAGRNGATDEEIKSLKQLLTLDELTAETVGQVENMIADMRKVAEANRSKYWVAAGCSVRIRGKTHKAGDEIALSADEAEDMGKTVSSKPPPKPQPKPAARQDGNYRVVGPGKIKLNGKKYATGAVIELDAESARDLGPTVEYIHPDSAGAPKDSA